MVRTNGFAAPTTNDSGRLYSDLLAKQHIHPLRSMLTHTTHSPAHGRGLSLVELLVSITIGLFILLGATMMVVPVSITNRETAQASKMNTDARAVLDIIGNEIIRAGYGTTASKITVTSSPDTCIVYPYKLAPLPTSPAYWGAFRRNGNRLQVRYDIPNTNNTPPACSTITQWQSLTDPATLEITTFNASCVNNTTITLTLSATTPHQHSLSNVSLSVSPRNTTCN